MIKTTEIGEAYQNLDDDSQSEFIGNTTQAFLRRLHLPSLSVEEASEMTRPISLQEISNTIKAPKSPKLLKF